MHNCCAFKSSLKNLGTSLLLILAHTQMSGAGVKTLAFGMTNSDAFEDDARSAKSGGSGHSKNSKGSKVSGSRRSSVHSSSKGGSAKNKSSKASSGHGYAKDMDPGMTYRVGPCAIHRP